VTEPLFGVGRWGLLAGDCVKVMQALRPASVDAVVTDPPYALSFMGKDWDSFGDGVGYQTWCERWAAQCVRLLKPGGQLFSFGGTRTVHRLTCAIEDMGFTVRDSLDWIHSQGFPKSRGTLKPAHEPIVWASKPGGGAGLNVDACRVGTETRVNPPARNVPGSGWGMRPKIPPSTVSGRWPPNVLFSHSPDCGPVCAPDCPVAELDRQSGQSVSRAQPVSVRRGGKATNLAMTRSGATYSDSGGASRFFPVFRYHPKAGKAERPAADDSQLHPTVKPVGVMRWLVRLATPPGGIVLDPFAGSGATAEACILEGFPCVLIEKEPAYLRQIGKRLSRYSSKESEAA